MSTHIYLRLLLLAAATLTRTLSAALATFSTLPLVLFLLFFRLPADLSLLALHHAAACVSGLRLLVYEALS
jgi:hypothetical protein